MRTPICSALATSAALLVSAPAAPAEGEGLEEIVVTATKRVTNLQQTPIAVAAYSGEELDARGVNDLRDVALTTPGFVIGGSAGFDFPTSLRGISSQASGIAADPAVAIYVDGVYYARGNSAVFGLVDIDRIEVLKGPQGTLFGRNATAGAVQIVSRLPGRDFEAAADFLIGRFDEFRLRGAISGPLGGDSTSLGVSGTFRRRDGFQTNAFDGRELNSEENKDVRTTLLYEPNDALQLILRADYGQYTTPQDNKGITQDPLFVPPLSLDSVSRVVRNIDQVSINETATPSDREQDGASLTLVYEIDSTTLTSITAFRESTVSFQVDTDGSAVQSLRSNQKYEEQSQWSQELQLASQAHGKLDWLLGLYYFTEDAETLFVADAFFANLRQGFNATSESRSYAAFGEFALHFTDALTTTLGLRYTYEEKAFSNIFEVLAGQPTDPAKAFPDPIPFSEPRFFDDASWSDVSPRLILDYRWSDNLMAYVSVSRGFKSGGYNFTSDTDAEFDPEVVWSYEIGLKSEFLDRRLRVNAAAYYQDYEDLQVRLASGPGVTSFRNAANARIAGLELDLVAALTDSLRFELGYSHIDATYQDYTSFAANAAACPGGMFDSMAQLCDLGGNRLNRAPEHSFTAALQNDWALPGGDATVQARVLYFLSTDAYYNDQNTFGNDGVETLDAHLSYIDSGGKWTLKIWGKNLTDDRYFTHATAIGPFLIGVPNVPRTYGIELGLRM